MPEEEIYQPEDTSWVLDAVASEGKDTDSDQAMDGDEGKPMNIDEMLH